MNDEMEKAERLFQQLSGNETTKNENLDHLKVCFQGDSEHGDKIIETLLELDGRVKNSTHLNGDFTLMYYYVDLTTLNIDIEYSIPTGYKLLDIEDYLDEEESCEDNCAECGEPINSGNQIMYYNDGDMCCESCYDEDLDMEEEDEEDLFEHPTPRVSDLERAENTFRLLSETQSAPKNVIDSKLSELSNITRRRRR